ncbi:MAG: hypothetical protein J6R59_11450 [Paludibacteraceae bacterium]|jgi:hypothetical protein|nr:hypothetical protein [Paludibacteraceae bacterium]
MADLDELYKSLLGETKEESISLNDIIKTLKVYWDFLLKRWWIVVICGLLGGALGLVYACLRTTNYEARYVFTIGGSSSSSSGMGSLTALLGLGSTSMGAFSGDNILELFKSRSLMENTLLSPIEYNGDTITFMEYSLICDSVRARCLEREPEESEKMEKISICDVEFPYGQSRSSFSRVQDSILLSKARALLQTNVMVEKRDKKLSYVEYVFTYPDEAFAKAFATSHLNQVSSFYVNTKTELSRLNIESFQDQADSVRRELDKALSSRAYYADGNMNAARQIVGVQLRKLETDIQILATSYAEMIKNIEVLKLDLARETPLIQIIDSPIFPLPNDKMRKAKWIVIGGFLGGFLSCLALVAFCYYLQLKEQMSTEVTTLPADKKEGEQ